MNSEDALKQVKLALSKIDRVWKSGIKGKCVLVAATAVLLFSLRASCGTGGRAEAYESARKEETPQKEVSPAEIAEKLFARYNPNIGLIHILHSGSRIVPEENTPYFIEANGFTKLCGGNGFDVFTDPHDVNDIYYDFCVTSSRGYVDGSRLSPGCYVYIGKRSYVTVSGAERTLYSFAEVEGDVMRVVRQLYNNIQQKQRELEAERVRERKKLNEEHLKSLETFVDEYVGTPFWSTLPNDGKDKRRRIIQLKKKFRYCDKALIECTYGGVDKVNEILLFGVLDKQYAYEALKKEAAMMLSELDRMTGARRADWSVKRDVQEKYEYEAILTLTQDMIYLNSNLPRNQCIGVRISKRGFPPKDDVLNELPPLQ